MDKYLKKNSPTPKLVKFDHPQFRQLVVPPRIFLSDWLEAKNLLIARRHKKKFQRPSLFPGLSFKTHQLLFDAKLLLRFGEMKIFIQMGRGGVIVVSGLAFYSKDPSSIPIGY